MSVEIETYPHVINICVGEDQTDTEAPERIRWGDVEYEMVGWIESTDEQFVGKVIVDDLIHCFDENHGTCTLAVQRPSQGNCNLSPKGRVERLFYIRIEADTEMF
jgi:hypothetical protein